MTGVLLAVLLGGAPMGAPTAGAWEDALRPAVVVPGEADELRALLGSLQAGTVLGTPAGDGTRGPAPYALGRAVVARDGARRRK